MEHEEEKRDEIDHLTESNSHSISLVHKKREWGKNLMLLLVTIFIVLICFEIYLRFFYPQKLYDKCYEYSYKNLSNLELELDSHLGWKLISNYSGCRYQPDTNKIIYKTHNLNGLRMDSGVSYEKDGKKRILLLGDSFVYGFGLDDNETIAVKLQENLGNDYEVIPMGVDGYGTGQEILQLMGEGLKYNPDVIILFFYPNDLPDTIKKQQDTADKPILYQAKNAKVTAPSSSNLITDKEIILKVLANELTKNNSHIKLLSQITDPNARELMLSENTAIFDNYPTNGIWSEGYGPNKKPLSTEHPVSSLLLKYSHFYSLIYHKIIKLDLSPRKKYFDTISDGVSNFLENNYRPEITDNSLFILSLFDEFENISKKNDFKFIIVGIPEKRNVNEEYQQKFLSQYSDIDKSMFEFRKIDMVFSEELPNRDIEYISLFDLAEEHFDEFYFKTDPHWNPSGVKLSADYITQELTERKII